ncbi:general stress protein [Pseudarthrobacter sp. PH31-O2]|uniref:general stress protein n=1 Tax=Pseudarthrobacter sp. PH31-O2 TaxID=3046206 RepID=UPI0024B883D4|nr:general stress protein [Pseudarthrobacter sp. PH31-O2]MDJ0354132.1 ECF transporter S component [Pseudarthrobacter sp. PH31-O2]
MSNIFGAPRAGARTGPDEARSVPKGDTVGSYNSYLDAQKAVDYLADQQFPVQMVSIVGNDLKMVERVTGRLTYPRVALSGALSGMWFGLFVGIMLSFFSTTDGAFSIMTSVLMGAAFFMLFGIVTYAMQRGKRDFTSTSQVVATNYDVVVSFEAANDARRLLHQLPMTQQDAARPAGAAGYSQPEHQHQPHQQPGRQQGPGPQRPAGWSDPYGQRTPDAGGDPREQPGNQPAAGQQSGPSQQGAGTASGKPAGEEEPVKAAGFAYPDLPDGRPQYGVRVDDAAKQEPGGGGPHH